jgi:hypothetical protein
MLRTNIWWQYTLTSLIIVDFRLWFQYNWLIKNSLKFGWVPLAPPCRLLPVGYKTITDGAKTFNTQPAKTTIAFFRCGYLTEPRSLSSLVLASYFGSGQSSRRDLWPDPGADRLSESSALPEPDCGPVRPQSSYQTKRKYLRSQAVVAVDATVQILVFNWMKTLA